MTWQPFLFQPNLFKSILHRNHKVQEIVLLFAGSNQLSQASNSSLWSFYSIHATIAYNIILWQSIYELNISDWTAGLAWQSKCHLFCKIFANNAEWNIIALSIFSKSWNEIILNLYRCQADHDLPAQISRALILHIFSTFIMQQQSFVNHHHEETLRVLVWILPCSDRKPNVWNCF